MKKGANLAALLFCLLCAAWYIRVTMWGWGDLDYPSDFTVYFDAARSVAAGRTPFVTWGYIYPPLLAYLLTPLTPLSYLAARWVWYLFSQACLLVGAWLMWRFMGRGRIAACSIAFVWAAGGAAVEALALGQLAPLLMLLLVVAYTQRGGRSAAAIGFGMALKFIPGILAAVLLLRRDKRGLAVFAGVTLALLVVPWSVTVCCLSGPKTPAGNVTWSGTPATLSWSLPSVALRILDPPTRGTGPVPPDWERTDLPSLRLPAGRRWISIGVALTTLLGGLSWLAFRAKDLSSPKQLPYLMAGLTSLGLAASPVSWAHYQDMQYPGVALLVCYAWRSRLWGVLGAACICFALLFPLPVAILTVYYQKYGRFTAASPATLYIWTSVAPLASLGLFWLLVRAGARASLPPKDAASALL